MRTETLSLTWSATSAAKERTNEERNLYSLSSWNGVRKEVKEEEGNDDRESERAENGSWRIEGKSANFPL